MSGQNISSKPPNITSATTNTPNPWWDLYVQDSKANTLEPLHICAEGSYEDVLLAMKNVFTLASHEALVLMPKGKEPFNVSKRAELFTESGHIKLSAFRGITKKDGEELDETYLTYFEDLE